MLDDELQQLYDEEVGDVDQLSLGAALDEMDDEDLVALHDAMGDMGEDLDKSAGSPLASEVLLADTWSRQLVHRTLVEGMVAEGRSAELAKLASRLNVDLLESARAAGLPDDLYGPIKTAGWDFQASHLGSPSSDEEAAKDPLISKKRKIRERLAKIRGEQSQETSYPEGAGVEDT